MSSLFHNCPFMFSSLLHYGLKRTFSLDHLNNQTTSSSTSEATAASTHLSTPQESQNEGSSAP